MARILIIKLGALGDVIVASAAIRQLLEWHRHDQVELLTAAAFATLIEGMTPQGIAVPRVRVYRRDSWWQQLKLIRQLRAQRYQRIYDLQGNDRSRALSWLSGAAIRIGLWPGWPYNLAPALARSDKCHPFQRISAQLEAAGVTPPDERLVLTTPAAEQERVEQWLNEHQGSAGRSFVLLHAGCNARWQSKRWSESSFAELAEALQAAGLTVIWIGGPDERSLNARLSARCGIDASGAFPISTLIALAAHARFAVTNDSAPMHALAAAAIPVYSFFGPTDWRLSHAVGQAGRILSAGVACSPCFNPQCPLTQNHHQCMTAITPAQVIQRLHADGLLRHRSDGDTASDTDRR